jgi:hypothetical protein
LAHVQDKKPAKHPVVEAPAKENEHSIISVIKQLQELGVINLPGQQGDDKKKKEPPCPQHGDEPINPHCPSHFVDQAGQILGQWLIAGDTDKGVPKHIESLLGRNFACSCTPGPEPEPGKLDCICPKGGGNQGEKTDKWNDTSRDNNAFGSDNNSKPQSGEPWAPGAWSGAEQSQQNSGFGETPATNSNNTQTPENNHQASTDDDHHSRKSSESNKSANGGGWGDQVDNTNNGWGDNNNDPGTKKDKDGSSKSKSKKSSAEKAAPVHEKPYTRSYWKGGEASAGSANSGRKCGQYTMPEDPIYTLSESKAKEFNVRHQVRGGKGLEEKKKTYKPLYWDNFDEPYAVFRFKYRSRGMFSPMFPNSHSSRPLFAVMMGLCPAQILLMDTLNTISLTWLYRLLWLIGPSGRAVAG